MKTSIILHKYVALMYSDGNCYLCVKVDMKFLNSVTDGNILDLLHDNANM